MRHTNYYDVHILIYCFNSRSIAKALWVPYVQRNIYARLRGKFRKFKRVTALTIPHVRHATCTIIFNLLMHYLVNVVMSFEFKYL